MAPDLEKWEKTWAGGGSEKRKKLRKKGVKMSKNAIFRGWGSKILKFWGLAPQISDPCQPMGWPLQRGFTLLYFTTVEIISSSSNTQVLTFGTQMPPLQNDHLPSKSRDLANALSSTSWQQNRWFGRASPMRMSIVAVGATIVAMQAPQRRTRDSAVHLESVA